MTLELSSYVNWSHQGRYPLPSRLTVMSRTPLEGGDPNIGLSSVPCQGLFSDTFAPLPQSGGGVRRSREGVFALKKIPVFLHPTPPPPFGVLPHAAREADHNRMHCHRNSVIPELCIMCLLNWFNDFSRCNNHLRFFLRNVLKYSQFLDHGIYKTNLSESAM